MKAGLGAVQIAPGTGYDAQNMIDKTKNDGLSFLNKTNDSPVLSAIAQAAANIKPAGQQPMIIRQEDPTPQKSWFLRDTIIPGFENFKTLAAVGAVAGTAVYIFSGPNNESNRGRKSKRR